jgi:hypothetical protein
MQLGKIVAFALLAAACAACGASQTSVETPGRKDDAAGNVATFQDVEDEVLRDLAAIDRRVAVRARIEPREEDSRRVSMSALLAEDPSLAVIDGVIDPFSFEARARGLGIVKEKLKKAPATLPTSAPGMMLAPRFEKELLDRVVDEEQVRLEEERALPRSASALVRAVVETWSPPATPELAAERDRWLSRRLVEIRTSIGEPSAAPNVLDVVRARELDDALDGLEHLMEASALARSTAELVNLREVLEGLATRPAASAASAWTDVARRVRSHLGFELAPDVLDRRFDALEKELRTAAEKAIAAEHLDGDALATHAASLVFASGSCGVAVPGSRLRSMAPPPERAPACRLRQAMASANDPVSRAYALVAMHDHVVVAQWALDVASGKATIAQSSGRHRPLSRPGPDVVARWERVALARPTAAIGGGLAADILEAGGEPDVRARKWAELGEVPLDIAERELALRPVDAAQAVAPVTNAPVSKSCASCQKHATPR